MASEWEKQNDLSFLAIVLILVLVEDGFRDLLSRGISDILKDVLILVLVEDGFRAQLFRNVHAPHNGLNPCSYGRWLQSTQSPPGSLCQAS